MAKLKRTVYAQGVCGVVEEALRADGTSPTMELFSHLEAGSWPDPEQNDFPDERQVRLKTRLLQRMKDFVDDVDLTRRELNYLADGVWEFKVTNLRVSFFDTDGAGSSVTTSAERSERSARWPSHELPDDFGEIARAGHYFAKDGDAAPPEDVDEALRIREEDLAHDG